MNLRKILFQIPTVSILFLILVPFVTHFLFSSLGFNPTDDGFTLAYSRRIIAGQIPHRDFIIIRPFLSPLLHVPFVLWGGDYTYILSRFFVWFQFSCMAWAGVFILEKGLRISFGNLERVSIALISMAVSAHTFRTMAWHTIDGLFFIILGLAFCFFPKRPWKTIGYLLMGMAYLCKQNFIFFAPFSIFILGDWRKIKYWLAILIPGLLYVLFLLLTGAMSDAILQLTSQSNLFYYGFYGYINPKFLLLALLGYLSARFITGSAQIKIPLNNSFKEWIGLVTLSVIPLIAISMTFISGEYILSASYWLFSLVVGVVGCFLLKKIEKPRGLGRIGMIFLLMAWSESISIGWPYPDLASGQLLALLLAFTLPIIRQKLEVRKRADIYTFALAVLSFLLLVSFGSARMRFITRDLPAEKLTERLDAVLPGGKGIRTNQNTYKFLFDLREAIHVSKNFGNSYAIIPDCAGWWVQSPQVNPLPIDWVQGIELNKPELVSRVIRDLDLMRNTNIVIVQKFQAKKLRDGFIPFDDEFTVVEYVRDHFTKVYETSLFELYK
jgi:hypothetical protein